MANPGTMTATLISNSIRDQFRAGMNDVIAPYRFSDAIFIAWLNEAIRTICAISAIGIVDSAILTVFPIDLTALSSSPDIPLKPGVQRAIVSFCMMKAFEFAKDQGGMKTYYDRYHQELKEFQAM